MDRLTSLQLWQHIWGRCPNYRCYSIISILYSGLVVVSHVFRQPWGNRVERTDQYFFSAAARWKHGFKLCWNPLLQTWLLNPGSSDGDSLCVTATSWTQLFAMQYSVPSPFTQLRRAQSSNIPSSVTGRRQSHKHIFTLSLPNKHRMTVKPKHMLQLVLISFSYCLMAMSLPQRQVSSSRGIVILIVLFQHRQMLQQHRAISTQCSWIMQLGWKENN